MAELKSHQKTLGGKNKGTGFGSTKGSWVRPTQVSAKEKSLRQDLIWEKDPQKKDKIRACIQELVDARLNLNDQD